MKTEAWMELRTCLFSTLEKFPHSVYVLVYVNQNDNLRVEANFYSSRFLPFCFFNGSVRRNFRAG